MLPVLWLVSIHEHCFQLFCNVGGWGTEWETVLGRADAAQSGNVLDRDGVDLPEERVHFGQNGTQTLPRETLVAVGAQTADLDHGKGL